MCSSSDIKIFLELKEIPVFCNIVYQTAEEARHVARGTITLGYCRACTHISNYSFDPDRVKYTGSYDNSLHFSHHFRLYAERLAADLLERYHIKKKTVLDIGCGKGEFLELLCTLGNNRGFGFDTSCVPEHSKQSDRMTIVRDTYSEQYADIAADLIACRHVLEHTHEPATFVNTLRGAAEKTGQAILYVEVPNGQYTLAQHAIWDIIYEHCSHFTKTSLRRLFARCGLEQLRMYEAFGGQYLAAECTAQNVVDRNSSESQETDGEMAGRVESFASTFEKKVREWRSTLENLRESKKRVAVWGAGSKGVTFLNIVDTERTVGCVVDVNPRKQGKHIASTAHRIHPPEHLIRYRPDVVIVMNRVYSVEIRTSLNDLGLAPKVLFA